MDEPLKPEDDDETKEEGNSAAEEANVGFYKRIEMNEMRDRYGIMLVVLPPLG